MRIKALLSVVFLMLGSSVALAEPQSGVVTLANDYIEIVVNAQEQNMGRFSVNTTGGDPYRPGDENKPLIYGGYNPWTSYTTIRVEGRNYIFGGPTQTRAGRAGLYGEIIQEPQIVGDQIVTISKVGEVEVKQSLGFARSSTTGLFDTARIEYTLTNKTDVPQRVGLRVVIDAMLGANDGAPLRVEEEQVLTERIYRAADMPTFWQAFDSLANPQVMAQGTLKGGEVSTPDEVFFSNWGNLADHPWEFNYQPGRDFTRTGEFELDSAIALRWTPKALAPQESITYVAYYGLGGITIAPGDLSLGVTSPASVVAGKQGIEPFPIIAYVENSGTGEARDVQISIDLGPGLRLLEGEATKGLGHLVSAASAQMKWLVVPTVETPGVLQFTIKVESTNSDSNSVTRQIEIVAPPEIVTSLEGPMGLGIQNDRWHPVPFRVTATLRNIGGADAYRVQAQFDSPVIDLAAGEGARKYVGNLEPGEETKISWSLRPAGFTGHLPYSVRTQAFNVEEGLANNFILVPMLRPHVRVVPTAFTEEELVEGDYFTVDIVATNIPDFYSGSVTLKYDPTAIKPVGGILAIDRGSLFVHQGDKGTEYLHWARGEVDHEAGTITLAGSRFPQGTLRRANGTLGTIRFQALRETVRTPIIIQELEIRNGDGDPIKKIESVDGLIKIVGRINKDN
ncbi:MAG: cohesin domain-containing protein [Limnochordia bacterium]|jgi:hypothetical protein